MNGWLAYPRHNYSLANAPNSFLHPQQHAHTHTRTHCMSFASKLGFVCIVIGAVAMSIGYVRATQANAIPPPRVVYRPPPLPPFVNAPPQPVVLDAPYPKNASYVAQHLRNQSDVLHHKIYPIQSVP